ncbi:MAG: GRRM system radical SAM/SPASM domain protein [Kiloniellaceae bacterium]
MASSPTIQLLVLQPTPFCNLNCGYCYLPQRGNRAVMQQATLAAIGRAIVASPAFTEETTLVWHAGEPCVLPAAWYRDARATIESAAGRELPRQAFQTNATLIDDAWIELFKEPGVSVGVSLDGPAEIHDRHRKTRAGGGTHAATLSGVGRLRRAGVPFHVIAVVTAASLDAPEAVAAALIASGAQSIGLNIEEIDGINAHSTLSAEGMEARYREFLDRFLETLAAADSPPRLREANFFSGVLSRRKDAGARRHQENVPGAIVTVGVTGAVSTFSPELLGVTDARYRDFVFGEVQRMRDIGEIFLSPALLRMYRDLRAGVRACRETCAYFGFCGGGAPANKLGEHGRLDRDETLHCRLTVKTTVESLLARVETHGRLVS